MKHSLKRVVDEIYNKLKESVNRGLDDDWDATEAFCNVDLNDGWLEITIGRNGYKDVLIFHDDDEKDSHKTPRLKEFIEDNLPDFDELKDECIEEDEDYHLRQQGLDPAFGSWDDYYRYRYGSRYWK